MKMNKIAAALVSGAVAASAMSVVAAADSYEAFLMVADAGWAWGDGCWNVGVGTDATITGDGTYTVSVNAEQVNAVGEDGSTWEGNGFVVFNVDIEGLADALGCGTADTDCKTLAEKQALAEAAGLSITDVSIILDGETAYTYKDSEVTFGDIEGNGKIRIELWNQYGETGSAGVAPIGVETLSTDAVYSEVAVQFTISGIGGGAAAEEAVEEAAPAVEEAAPAADSTTTAATTGNTSAAALAGIMAVAAAAIAVSKRK